MLKRGSKKEYIRFVVINCECKFEEIVRTSADGRGESICSAARKTVAFSYLRGNVRDWLVDKGQDFLHTLRDVI
jgi:hypothetical protein